MATYTNDKSLNVGLNQPQYQSSPPQLAYQQSAAYQQPLQHQVYQNQTSQVYPDNQQQLQQMQYQAQQPQQPMQMKAEQYNAGPAGGAPREWENGMFSCYDDMSTCCMGCWCPCIVYSKIQHRTRHPSMDNFSSCNAACWGFYCLSTCGFQWILSAIQRGDVRAKYNLAGSGLGDFARHCCCECCALIQEDKETALRKSQEASSTTTYTQVPQAHQGMVYQQQ